MQIVPHALPIDHLGSKGLGDLTTDEELLVFLTASQSKPSGLAQELIGSSVKALTQTHHNAKWHFGFLKAPGIRPYVVVEWTKPGANALERRYVLNDLGKVLLSQWALRKIVMVLDEGCGAGELVQCEDLAMRGRSALYQKSKWESIRVMSANPRSLTDQDPMRAIRERYHLNYRSWINEDADQLTSLEIGSRLEKFAAASECRFESLDESALKDRGLNLLVAVGQASKRSPSRLHIVTSRVDRSQSAGAKPLMLVGKGITFDSGGINLKPHEAHINCMKNDMGGAALMANVFMALVEGGYAGPLALVIPSCENLIDAKSVKPGAIIKSYRGKNVIIEHTDAEGRLILADAMAYAEDLLKPKFMMTAATLTTAALRQFTNWYTPVHFAAPALRHALDKAGSHWGELFTFWDEFLPFAEGNRTNAADLTNMGRMPSHASIGGGSNVAAHFLKNFATVPYAHMDMFASCWNWSGDYPGAHYGATGAPFNSLLYALRECGEGL